MLSILGRGQRYCDGLSRRGFLKVGAFSFGATTLTLTDVFRAEALVPRPRSHKAVIQVYLAGGPPHQDMWDIKTDAPREIKGEFNAIATNVPGIQICEVFPRMAQLMDKCAIIRSIVGCQDDHSPEICYTGWPRNSLQNLGGRPSVSAAVNRVLGPVDPSVPTAVGLAKPTQHMPWSDAGRPGFLGMSHAPFRPDGPGMANLRLNGISPETLEDRRQLLQSFDDMRRDLDTSGTLDAMDAASQRALGVLTSSKLLDALDQGRESPRVRDRYGNGRPYQFQFDGAPTVNEQLLLARRLVEAGVRCVTLSYGRWDSHGQNFAMVRDHGGKLDQCLSALIEDLRVRGMLDDVLVVVWGEFGRTPRVNKDAGRDHWPQVSCCLLAGGGIKAGQVIGATNRLGEFASARPVHPGEVIATVYQTLGIDVTTTTINDPTGRPQHLVDRGVMRELVG
ncbi:MAG TPA: DUF1501 domain-containing protein [Gemmataceae bacterium]|nr:DUF1501 domain-containing protein [Gemmataceae bacterium]